MRGSILVALFLVAACSGELPMSGFISSTATLPAEDFQREIMEIDELVFAEKGIGESGRSDLASKLEDLSTRVDGAKGDSTFLGLQARELKGLAARMRRISATGPVPAPLRDYWMRIRSNVFDDRWWFARSAADLSAPEIAAAKPAAKPAATEDAVEPEPAPVVNPPAYRPGTGPATILEGRWATRAISLNGRPTSDPEMTGSWWIFQGDQIVIHSSTGEASGRYRFQVVIDERGGALRVESISGSEPPENGWMIYELSGDELHLAFFDGLRERPDGFEPDPPDREPELVVLTLMRSP